MTSRTSGNVALATPCIIGSEAGTGIEPVTSGVANQRFYQLSYPAVCN